MVLDKKDWRDAGKAAIVWFAPVALLYISAVLGVLQVEGHTFSVSDLVPSTFTIGSVVTWGLMQVQGLLLRWVADGKR